MPDGQSVNKKALLQRDTMKVSLQQGSIHYPRTTINWRYLYYAPSERQYRFPTFIVF